MAVLICIAMWVLYLVFVQGDIHKQKVADKKNQIRLEWKKKFWEMVHDHDLEYDLRKKISDPSYVDEVRREVYDVLSALPKRNEYDERHACVNFVDAFCGDYDEALVVMMAKRGKLPAHNRYVSSFNVNYHGWASVPDRIHRIRVLGAWACTELNHHGISCRLEDNGSLCGLCWYPV